MNGPASIDPEIISVGAPLPRMEQAFALDERNVRIVWQGGRETVLDLAPVLLSRRLYIPLRDDNILFATVRVSEYGDAIEWDGGIEISALWLTRLTPTEFTNSDFREAIAALGMSLEGMAAALGISRRQIAAYRKDKKIPRHIALATRFLLFRRHADGVV